VTLRRAPARADRSGRRSARRVVSLSVTRYPESQLTVSLRRLLGATYGHRVRSAPSVAFRVTPGRTPPNRARATAPPGPGTHRSTGVKRGRTELRSRRARSPPEPDS